MTFSETEKKATQLAFEEKLYRLIAIALEEKADNYKQQAAQYHERATALLEQQSKIWQEFTET